MNNCCSTGCCAGGNIRRRLSGVEDEDCCYFWKTYTIKANLLYYLDKFFDTLFGQVADCPEDLVHMILFILTLVVRLIFMALLHSYRCCCDWEGPNFSFRKESGEERSAVFCEEGCNSRFRTESGEEIEWRAAEWKSAVRSTVLCENVDVKNSAIDSDSISYMHKFFLRMANFGVKARKLKYDESGRDESIVTCDTKRCFCVDFKLQSYDSVNNYTNLAMIAFVSYVYVSAVYALHITVDEDQWMQRLIMWTDEHFQYELDMADFTFVCLWIISSLVLRIVERVYLLWALASRLADKGETSTIPRLLGLILGNSIRMPIDRLLQSEKSDGSQIWLDARLAKFELQFVRFFCDEETYLKMRRRNRSAQHFKKNQLSFHKYMVCFIFTLVVSVVVKFFVTGSYGLEYLTICDCKAHRGICIDGDGSEFCIDEDCIDGDGSESCIYEDDSDKCWCGTNLLYDVTTFFVVAVGGSFGSAATVRAVMNVIFKSWRQKKVKDGLGYTQTNRVNGDVQMVIPYEAVITKAIYGHPKNVPSFIKEVKTKIEKLRKFDFQGYDNWCDDLRKMLDEYRCVDVTEQIQHYLYQGMGNTVFKIGDVPENTNPFLIVFGEWRGATLQCNTIAAHEEERNVVQIIYLSEASDEVKWERKPFTDASKMKFVKRAVELPPKDDVKNEKTEIELIYLGNDKY